MEKPTFFENLISSLIVIVNEWSNVLDRVKDTKDLKELCTLWLRFNEQYDAIDEQRKRLLILFDQLNEGILPGAFEEQGIDKIAIPELGRSFYPLDKYSATIAKNRFEEAKVWLIEKGLQALITETVNRQTLAATLRGRLVEEGLDPPECMTLEKYQIIGSSKYTPKKGGK